MYLILLGAPGAGKGTQAKKIMQKYQIPQISTGEILRKEIREGSELGQKAKIVMENGELVSDALILDMVQNRLNENDCRTGFILDGFPRTIAQAEGLDVILSKKGNIQLHVVEIFVPDALIIKRLTSRRVCSECATDYNLYLNPPNADNICTVCGGKIIQRDDDQEATIKNRLEVYGKQTAPLINYYKTKGNFHQVKGDDPIDEIFDNIQKILNK